MNNIYLCLGLESIKTIADIFYSFSIAIIAIFTSYWAYKKYFLSRESDTKLSLSLSDRQYKLETNDKNSMVYLEATLENKGGVKITSAQRFNKDADGKEQPAYKDDIEEIFFPFEMQIKKLNLENNFIWLKWLDNTKFVEINDLDRRINLLTDEESPKQKLAFFIEPKEIYHSGVWVKLSPGLYMIKLIFIGSKQPEEFWSQKFPLKVE